MINPLMNLFVGGVPVMKQALLSLVCSLGLLVGTAVAEPIGGVVYGSGTVDNDTTTHSIGPYFNFATGMSQLELDTTGAHIQVDTNEGGGFQPVRWTATDTVGFYRRIGLATSGSLDSITSVPAYDGTNYATYTSDRSSARVICLWRSASCGRSTVGTRTRC